MLCEPADATRLGTASVVWVVALINKPNNLRKASSGHIQSKFGLCRSNIPRLYRQPAWELNVYKVVAKKRSATQNMRRAFDVLGLKGLYPKFNNAMWIYSQLRLDTPDKPAI